MHEPRYVVAIGNHRKSEALAKQLFTLRRWTGWLVILMVLTHITAALYHHSIHHDAVLKRMLPRVMGGF